MIKKISEDVWSVNAGSMVYFLDVDEKILIDTGERQKRQILQQFLDKVVDFDKIQKVIFTHLHYDHIGNFDLFPNARFYASSTEIASLKKDRLGTILNKDMAGKFNVDLLPLTNMNGLEIIETPGHTAGSVCLWYPKDLLLFTGDTIFRKGYGRTDLPTSLPGKMTESAMKLVELQYKKMCPGHDY